MPAGGHVPQAGAHDIRVHEAQLGSRQLTQQLAKPGHILSGQIGQIPPLPMYRKSVSSHWTHYVILVDLMHLLNGFTINTVKRFWAEMLNLTLHHH